MTAEMLRLARQLDSVEKASFLALMAAMADDGADIRDALEIGNRILTDAGRAPLWFLKDFAPASDTKEGDSMSKKKVMDADKLEILNIRLHCACALLDVVQGAVAENRTADTTDALYSVLETFQRIQRDLETEFEKAADV